jgi:hypothetical protein
MHTNNGCPKIKQQLCELTNKGREILASLLVGSSVKTITSDNFSKFGIPTKTAKKIWGLLRQKEE